MLGVMRVQRWQSGQGMVEYALILALVALIVIVALIATGGQLINLFSNISATMCNYHVGCCPFRGGDRCPPPRTLPSRRRRWVAPGKWHVWGTAGIIRPEAPHCIYSLR